MLVLPILVPLSTAAVLMLAPKRPAPNGGFRCGFGPSLTSACHSCERGRRSGAANQRLAGPIRHHPGGRPARGDSGRRGGVVGTAISVVAFSGVDPRRSFRLPPLLQILRGVAGAFLTGDFFNLMSGSR